VNGYRFSDRGKTFIISANRSFIDSFKVTREETLGNFIYDLGNKQWDIPKLRELLETILNPVLEPP